MTNYGKNNFRAIISVQYFFESFSKKPIVIGPSQLEIRNQDLFSVTKTKKETAIGVELKWEKFFDVKYVSNLLFDLVLFLLMFT